MSAAGNGNMIRIQENSCKFNNVPLIKFNS